MPLHQTVLFTVSRREGRDVVSLPTTRASQNAFTTISSPVKKISNFIDLTLSDGSSSTLSDSTQSLRRSTRPLKPRINFEPVESKPRKYTKRKSDSAHELIKRVKVDEKKSVTLYINTRRLQVVNAHKAYLLRYRHIFEPVLPSTKSFNTLEKEMSIMHAKTAYVPFHELDKQPALINGGQMKEYQLHGLSFLAYMYHNGMNCILGDEMGLGKTLQTLSLFAYIHENATGHIDPHLVICPLSVLNNWEAEAKMWFAPGTFKTILVHGSMTERERIKNSLRGDTKFDVCVTTYETYVAEHNWFKSRRWTYCVLDEGHRIKNSNTELSKRLQGLGSLYRLLLTGTPVQNNLVELWSLLHWLYPNLFTEKTENAFKDAFNLEGGKYSLPFLKSAEALLSTVMIRRTKATVEQRLAPREELTVFIPMSECQRFWTYRLLKRMDTLELNQIFTVPTDSSADSNTDAGRRAVQEQVAAQLAMGQSSSPQTGKPHTKATWTKLMNLVMQLRRVCDHPYILKGSEPDPYIVGEHIVASSSKLIAIDKLLGKILPIGDKVLIFSQWTDMLDILDDFLELRGISFLRLDGSTQRARRSLNIRLFQKENSPYQVFLLATKAAGLGINLTRASHVIMVDSDWNPQNDLQAIARAHRIGQTKTVHVYRLICQGSVEDQMLDRIRRKLFLSLKVMSGSDSADDADRSLKTGELMDMLRKGSSVLDDGIDLGHFLQSSIDDILAESKKREGGRIAKVAKAETGKVEEGDAQLMADAEEEERKLLQGVARVHSRFFEGQTHDNKSISSSNTDIAAEWEERQKRKRTNLLIMVDGRAYQPEMTAPVPVIERIQLSAPKKKVGKRYENEDWCIHCRDGGNMVGCSHCPRVFHLSCAGLRKDALKRSNLSCAQHECAQCFRKAGDVGGMLFRCQTCPQAFCDDCLPPDDFDVVGDTLPEFRVLGYGVTSSAFFIRCHTCLAEFKKNPALWASWQEEMAETEAKVSSLSLQS